MYQGRRPVVRLLITRDCRCQLLILSVFVALSHTVMRSRDYRCQFGVTV